MIKLLLYIWQLPQNIIGYLLTKAVKGVHTVRYKDAIVTYCKGNGSAISLGKYIIVFHTTFYLYSTNETLIKHEYGHCRQSKILGMFYLIFIGLPSIIWAGCFKKFREERNISYYWFYTEKWADKLGKVERR